MRRFPLLKPNSSAFAYLMLGLAQLMVALNVVGSKLVSSHISLLLAVFVRFGFASLIIWGIYLLLGQISKSHFQMTKKQFLLLALQGLCAGLFFNALLFMGLKYTSAAMAGMIISILPAIIACAAVIFLKETLTKQQIFGIFLAIIGIVILNLNDYYQSQSFKLSDLIGIGLLLLALLPETAYYLISKHYDNHQPMLVFTGLLNLSNVIFLFPIIFFSYQLTDIHLSQLTIWTLLLTGIASALFYIFWYLGAKKVSAAKAGSFTALSPLFTVLLASTVLSEKIYTLHIVGMLFIVSSIVLSAKK